VISNSAQSRITVVGTGLPGLIFIALLAGNLPLTWPVSGDETAYKELITHTEHLWAAT